MNEHFLHAERLSSYVARSWLKAGPLLGRLVLFLFLAPLAAPAQTHTNAPSRPAYSTFGIITERNIFNPRRYSRNSPRQEKPASRVDSFTLVGTMSYEKGDLAFFEGSSSNLRKVAKTSDAIAGYKITNISYNSVTLSSETNALQHEVKLRVGMQMRREDEGPWHLASAAEMTSTASVASNSSASSAEGAAALNPTGDSNSSATASDDPVLKRLMQRREQENNR